MHAPREESGPHVSEFHARASVCCQAPIAREPMADDRTTGRGGLAVQRRAGVGITRRTMLLGALLPIAACVADTAWLAGGRRDLASWLRALVPGWRAAALG